MLNQLITTIAILTATAVPINTGTAVLPSTYEIPQEIKYESVLTREQVRELVSKYDWDVDVATAVFLAESDGRRDIVNWGDSHSGCKGSYGLAQSACSHTPNPEELKDPEKNIEVAHRLWKERGWKPWGAYTDGRYLKYL